LIEAGLAFSAEDTNGFEQAEGPKRIGVGRVFRRFERDLHMRLRREIVDLIRLRFLHDADDVGRVGHIAVMQIEGNTLLVRIMYQMIDALGIEGRRTALHAMDDVSLGQKKFGEVGAILPGHAGDEGHLAR
jgi:hypothetical protein